MVGAFLSRTLGPHVSQWATPRAGLLTLEEGFSPAKTGPAPPDLEIKGLELKPSLLPLFKWKNISLPTHACHPSSKGAEVGSCPSPFISHSHSFPNPLHSGGQFQRPLDPTGGPGLNSRTAGSCTLGD